jgi:hypothetical protein
MGPSDHRDQDHPRGLLQDFIPPLTLAAR